MTDTVGHSTTVEGTEESGGVAPTQLPPTPIPPSSTTQEPNPPPPTASLSDANNGATNDVAEDQPRAKEAKGEPLNILVRDQTGAGLQFKVRKNTKFEKVMMAFCQKKNYQMSQVRFLYDGERVQKHQTPQSVDMEEGDVIDCVIEQLGGSGGDCYSL